jgi:hypothetical protein
MYSVNREAVEYFLRAVWPLVLEAIPLSWFPVPPRLTGPKSQLVNWANTAVSDLPGNVGPLPAEA